MFFFKIFNSASLHDSNYLHQRKAATDDKQKKNMYLALLIYGVITLNIPVFNCPP